MQRTRLLVRLPKRQGERLEAVLQLVIGADGQVSLAGADADQRDDSSLPRNRIRFKN
jgi:hypothetical protein